MNGSDLEFRVSVGSVAQDAILRIRRGWAGAQDNILRHITAAFWWPTFPHEHAMFVKKLRSLVFE